MIKFGPAGDFTLRLSRADHRRDFQQLYASHVDFVWRNLRRQGVPDMSIEDAVQDVFIVAHRKLPSFAGRSSLRTWIYAIARRVAFRYRRSASRTERKREALAHVPPDTGGLEHRLVLREAARILRDFLDTLDAPKREAFVLGVLEGFTRNELGEALGVRPNTAYSRLRAAREAFEARFGPSTLEPAAALLDGDRLATGPTPSERERVRMAASALLLEVADTATVSLGVKLAITGVVFAAAAAVAVAARTTESERESPRVQLEPAAAPPPAFPSPPDFEPASISGSRRAVVEPSSPLRQAATRSATASTSHRRDPDPPEPTSTLARETDLMQRVRQALAGEQFETALDLVGEHEREFGQGLLVLERRVSQVVALCRLGREAQAEKAGRRFLDEHPDHPLAAVVARNCPLIKRSPSGDSPR
jgi:RNA polymerase sigma-70 factor (ECF subfamily)